MKAWVVRRNRLAAVVQITKLLLVLVDSGRVHSAVHFAVYVDQRNITKMVMMLCQYKCLCMCVYTSGVHLHIQLQQHRQSHFRYK